MGRLARFPDATRMTGRMRISVRGAVQGVGFRPFVYRLARELEVRGCIWNGSDGVFVEAEADETTLALFLRRLEKESPQRAIIQGIETVRLEPIGYVGFAIRESDRAGTMSAFVLPDIAVCDRCLAELSDPADRRYRYPFTNCTHCGPRYTILEEMPYDRPATSMKGFAMCADCAREYADPADRRFHAQPIACPACGPQLELWDSRGNVLASRDAALRGAALLIREGNILALKGLGGFQLLADAARDDIIGTLRKRKRREEKPFALLFRDANQIRDFCLLSEAEERLLSSPEAPIVLLRRRTENGDGGTAITPLVAPGNPFLGAMRPYTPLHHLLMQELGTPVVATSGNRADEPMCVDEREALARLRGIADYFLVHDRPILRPVDDSVARILLGRETILRRARGYAPLPLPLPATEDPEGEAGVCALALGGHLKNSIALRVGGNVFVSQHIGDLETEEARSAFERTVGDLTRMYRCAPGIVIRDLHPDYFSSMHADQMGGDVRAVQHHAAHIASCRAENMLSGPALGVAWDGAGYGTDGTIWGGEFFLCDGRDFRRVARLRPFRLPGGEKAMRDARRCALGLLHEMGGEAIFDPASPLRFVPFAREELNGLHGMLRSRTGCPATSSAGRLFDAVASITGVRHRSAFEGQAAMMLEWTADEAATGCYPFLLAQDSLPHLDWEPAIDAILRDLAHAVSVSKIAGKFHNTLAEMILAVAERVEEPCVILSGGCFQNALLLTRTVDRLRAQGFTPFWHQRVPTNDGGISFGQIALGTGVASGFPARSDVPWKGRPAALEMIPRG